MESSTLVNARRTPKKVVPLQLSASQEDTTRKCCSLTTSSTSASLLSTTFSTRTHGGGRLSPAQIASFKTKIKTYSTDTSAAYTRSRAFLSFLNGIESPARNGTLQGAPTGQGDEDKENLKIPVHVNITKKGSFEIPFGIPRSPTSIVLECEMTIQHPFFVTDGNEVDMALDLETPTSTSLIFTVEVDLFEGTADIILLGPIPSQAGDGVQGIGDESTTLTETQPTLVSLKRTGSHRQNRSGGWYMKSPETGLFAEIEKK